MIEIIESCRWYKVLASVKDMQIPDCWLAGGAVRNTVWQELYGNKCTLKIKDLDLVFFDKTSAKEKELEYKNILEKLHPDWIFDVKNQSGFGVWRPWHFKFFDSADGIAHFLHTANSIGLRLSNAEKIEICAPHGLEDLFSGIIRTTPYRHDDAAAKKQQAEFLANCPGLSLK